MKHIFERSGDLNIGATLLYATDASGLNLSYTLHKDQAFETLLAEDEAKHMFLMGDMVAVYTIDDETIYSRLTSMIETVDGVYFTSDRATRTFNLEVIAPEEPDPTQ